MVEDYQAMFGVNQLARTNESMAEALGAEHRTCAWCGATLPKWFMVRWSGFYFCDAIQRHYFRVMLKAERLAFEGKDDEVVKEFTEVVGEVVKWDRFPTLSRLLNETVDVTEGSIKNEKNSEYVTEVVGEGKCLFCGVMIEQRKEGRTAKFCKVAHRVAYNRLMKAMATGEVLPAVADDEDFVQPDAIVEPVAKRAYTKTAERWTKENLSGFVHSSRTLKTPTPEQVFVNLMGWAATIAFDLPKMQPHLAFTCTELMKV